MARPRSDIAPRIVHAARRRFLDGGVEAASLRRIARDAKTSIGMVYYYYPTKDALFLAVVEEIYGRVLADLAKALEPSLPVKERMRRALVRFGTLSDEELVVVQLVIRELLFSAKRRALLFERFAHGHIPMIAGTLMEGLANGSIAKEYPPAVVVLATAGCGVFSQVIRRVAGDAFPIPGAPAGGELASALTNVLFDGLSPRPASQGEAS